MKKTLLFIAVGLILIASSCYAQGKIKMATHITTVQELQNMKDNLAEDYILDNDIDASVTSGWNGGLGFEPVGDNVNPFTGSLNGQGYKITNLFINRPATNYVGLFGYINTLMYLVQLGLENCNITGNLRVGCLVGYIDGYIYGCYATGEVNGIRYVGGLVGDSYAWLDLCHTDVSVQVLGDVNSDIDRIGGLVGLLHTEDRVLECYATGDITIGNTVINIANDIEHLGGLVGQAEAATVVSDSYATGNITAGNSVGFLSLIGGLIGEGRGTVSDSYATGNIILGNAGASINYTGGLIGMKRGTVSDCYATGNITVGDSDNAITSIGGLVGHHYSGTISRSYAASTITTGDALGASDTAIVSIGGLIGYNWYLATVSECCATVNIITGNAPGAGPLGIDIVAIGGFVGHNDRGSISKSWAKGNVTTGDANGDIKDLGGFAGLNDGSIENCYSRADITAGDSLANIEVIAGFCGYNKDTISKVYSTGTISTGTAGGSISNIGGLVGQNDDTVSNSFWDTQASGEAISDGGTGKTTAQMKTKSTFTDAGWDFAAIWQICEPPAYVPSYPWLRANDKCEVHVCSPAGPGAEAVMVCFTG